MTAPLQRVIDKLPGARDRGHYFIARCPAHEDAVPSLSVSEGADGRVLLKCFAGCPVRRIVGSLGLTMRDLFERRSR